MADEHQTDDNVEGETNILYDFTVQAEWPQDPETVYRSIVREKQQLSTTSKIYAVAQRSAWSTLQIIGLPIGSSLPGSLPTRLASLVNSRLNWHVAVTRDGSHVAILQDTALEIRSSKDDFSTVVGRCIIPKDTHPQWRHLAWSPDGDTVACSSSCGHVELFDLFGSPICTIASSANVKPNMPVDLSCAVCALIFKEHKEKPHVMELLVVTYKGILTSYCITDDGQWSIRHTFTFSGLNCPQGIAAVVHHPAHNLLLVGGRGQWQAQNQNSKTATAMEYGITAWRILSGAPHYKMVTDYEHDVMTAQMKGQWLLQKLRNSVHSTWQTEEKDGIYKLCLSPDGQTLAAVHNSGRLTLVDVPSLRIQHSWALSEQPLYSEVNQAVAENPKKRKHMKEHLQAFYVIDAGWWSDEAVIIARGTGAVTVSSPRTLRNLLGPGPEWFDPMPLVSSAHNGGFLGMECECRYSALKRHLVEEDDNKEFEDSDDEEEAAMLARTMNYVRQVLYFVTDSARFQPPRKRPKLVTRTYRLVNLRSTTPEELYARKIDAEEYGEALMLAKTYNLDCDLVYQRQWRRTHVSVASIQDYLSKISKRSWVLRECLERVPEDIDAMRGLLEYGLQGTDLEALIAIGKGEDDGRFILCEREEVYESIDCYNMEEAMMSAEEDEAKRKRREELLAQVDFDNLTLAQRELCRSRLRLLQFSDRLLTYEEVLGGPQAAGERYDYRFFEKFRSENIVRLAVNYARDCDWRGVDVILTYHGNNTIKHRLAILSNFPETFHPYEYRSLLLETRCRDGNLEVLPWTQECWRQPDWVEQHKRRILPDLTSEDLGSWLYEENPEYKQFQGAALTRDQLSKWYQYRACEIERLSKLVEFALVLVKYGIERHVEGLQLLHDDLVTMETLVYECHIDDTLTFEDMKTMPLIDRLRLMMSCSSEEMYIKNVKRWLLPFLQRCNRTNEGCSDQLMVKYLISMAKVDLGLCLKIFQASKADQPDPIIDSEMLLITVALECIYACESTDQLSNAFAILECLPERGFGTISKVLQALHNQVDELECQLSAAEILENNDLSQTIAFIRDTQNDAEEAKKLFTKLTRVAGRKTPALGAKQWRVLLTDLLALQEKVYHCIKPSTCYEIFVESLLCSGRLENIHLAGEMVQTSGHQGHERLHQSSMNSPEGAHIWKVPYERAVELVLMAAQEYFDSSANLTDSSMDLARACLNVITDMPQTVLDELDLIQSLALLNGFGVNILPIQVRMCNDRLELIQKAVDSKPFTYKNSQRLLRLGELLRVGGSNDVERHGRVLRVIAQVALKVQDHSVAYENCYRLMEMGYPDIWPECKELAEAEQFRDIPAKMELLCFAITYCTPKVIEPILRAKCLLETQILCERVNCQVADSKNQSPGESPFSARGAIRQTKEILSSTNKATRAALLHVSDTRWWTKTLSSLSMPKPKPGSEVDDGNRKLERQGCHPFYESVIDGCYSNRLEADYQHYQVPPSGSNLSENILRAEKLEETMTEGRAAHPASEVLQQLAEDSLSRDSTLGLAFLLTLPQPVDADQCFMKHPTTAVSLQLAMYYYALQIYKTLPQESIPCSDPAYLHSPADVIKRALKLAKSCQSKKVSDIEFTPVMNSLADKLLSYNECLMDFAQAQTLQALSRGIDTSRFAEDAEYRQETILGLAMSLETSVCDIAVSLAQRYNVPLWHVYMTHLEFLFDSGLTTEEIDARIRQEKLLPTLTASPSEFHARMNKYIYPTIAGTDHEALVHYYSLLDSCPLEPQDTDSVPPVTHVKLLRKIKTVASDLDYKKLVDGKMRPLDVICPILNTENVNTLAKLASKIPDKTGGFLHPSVVYCAWAVKLFWEGDPAAKKKREVTSTADWVHRYEACSEYLHKLLPEDVTQFVDAITFVPRSLQQLRFDARREIVRRALKYSRQNSGKKKKPESVSTEVTWDDVAQHLQQSLTHLETLSHPIITALLDSQVPLEQTFAQQYDLSRSQPHKLWQLLLGMVVGGQCPARVDSVLQVVKVKDWTTRRVVSEAMALIVVALSAGETSVDSQLLLEDNDPMEILQRIIDQVSQHQNDGGTLVGSEDVMTQLRPFCSNSTIEVKLRLRILKILEQSFSLSDGDLQLLILYRTQAVVAAAWPELQVTEDNIWSDVKRSELFDKLLDGSPDMTQFLTLSDLLKVWPPLRVTTSRSDEPASQPWCQLMTHMITSCGKCSGSHIVDIVKHLQASMLLSQPCLKVIFNHLVKQNMAIEAVKCLLLGEHAELYDVAVSQLKEQAHVEDDDELTVLLLQRHLTTNVVNTPYYLKLVSYVLANQQGDDETPYYLQVPVLANQLQEAGLALEAGSLVLQYRGTHPLLRTFDAALGVLNKMFDK